MKLNFSNIFSSVKIKYLYGFIVILFCFSCYKKDKGQFIFFQGEIPITVKDYDVYINDLDNIFLVIKNFNRRSYIVNNKIDSLQYVVNGKIYKADLNKINGKLSKFSLTTQNDRSRLFVDGFNQYKQELLYLGQKEDLKFIVNSNELIALEEE